MHVSVLFAAALAAQSPSQESEPRAELRLQGRPLVLTASRDSTGAPKRPRRPAPARVDYPEPAPLVARVGEDGVLTVGHGERPATSAAREEPK